MGVRISLIKKAEMDQLGTLEELILLTVCSLGEDAYGVSVHQKLGEHTGRPLTLGAVHTTLYRLQDKGFVDSTMGGATNTRGGRRKRYFRATGSGIAALRSSRDVRKSFWKTIPAMDSAVALR